VGGAEALGLGLRARLNFGEEVLIHEPCYVSYKPVIRLAGGQPKVIETEVRTGFKLTPQALSAACTSQTKALIFNYPCNPTGTTYKREELEELGRIIKRNDLILISDEIYHQLSYDHPHFSLASLPDFKARTLYLNGFSKGYAMTGWRVGYACGPEPLISAMVKIHQYTMLCVPIMGQFAALEAIKNGESAVSEMKKEYGQRRNFVVKSLNALGLRCQNPGGAFYVFPQIPSEFQSSLEFANDLLKEQKVAVVPGNAFGRDNRHIRISYASSMAKLQTAMHRIEKFILSKQKTVSLTH